MLEPGTAVEQDDYAESGGRGVASAGGESTDADNVITVGKSGTGLVSDGLETGTGVGQAILVVVVEEEEASLGAALGVVKQVAVGFDDLKVEIVLGEPSEADFKSWANGLESDAIQVCVPGCSAVGF